MSLAITYVKERKLNELYSDKEKEAMATIVMMPRQMVRPGVEINQCRVISVAQEIFDCIENEGSFEMNSCRAWAQKARVSNVGKAQVKKVLEACGVTFTGGDRFTGPLIAHLER